MNSHELLNHGDTETRSFLFFVFSVSEPVLSAVEACLRGSKGVQREFDQDKKQAFFTIPSLIVQKLR